MSELGFWPLAQQNPDRLAVVDPTGRELTASQVLASSNRIVHGLRALGLEKGDSIAIVLSNCAEAIEIFMAAAQAGWYVTPINWHLAAPEIAYIVEDSGAKAIFCSPRFGGALPEGGGLDRLSAQRPLRGRRGHSELSSHGHAHRRTVERSARQPIGGRSDDVHLGHDGKAQRRSPTNG